MRPPLQSFGLLALPAALLLTSCSLTGVPKPQQPALPPPPPIVSAPPAPAEPEFRVSLSATSVPQGDLLVVRLTTSTAPAAGPTGGEAGGGQPAGSGPTPQLKGWDAPRAFTQLGDQWVLLLPVSYAAEPGPRDLAVEIGGQRLSARVTVTKTGFPESRVYVSEETGNLLTDPQVEKDQERVAAIKARVSPKPLWSGSFAWPVKGKITTEFGLVRYVNDQPEGRHSGLDIAAPAGTPVLAPAAGRVVLADRLVLTGYTVVVDHGLGLFSSYSHLQSFSVKEGQVLAAGQTIGKVGSTGLSSGPHLHWTVSIGSTPTNPRLLLGADPLSLPATVIAPEGAASGASTGATAGASGANGANGAPATP